MVERFTGCALILLALLLAILQVELASAVPFQFTYDDDPNEGFWDPIVGDNRRAAMERAGQILGSYLIPSYSGEIITVRAGFADLGASTNASTSPETIVNEPNGLNANQAYPSALANHLLGQDINAVPHDIVITFNSTATFYTGLDGSPSTSEQDFIRVAMHEMTHGLGFSKHLLENGDYFESPTIYDNFLTLSPFGTQVRTLDEADRAAAQTGDNLFWNGASAVLGNGGAAPKIYAPNPYASGSSVSHLDETTYTTTLMTPFGSPGQLTRTLTPLERGMLLDMGWTVNVFPQTTTWTGAVSNEWLGAQNWSPATVPTIGDNVVFDSSAQTDVAITYSEAGGIFPQTQFLNSLSFAAGAPAYTLRFGLRTITEFTGPGIAVNSGAPQTIVLESIEDDPAAAVTLLPDAGADMIFRNSASAGNVKYELHGDVAALEQIAPQQYAIIRHGIVRVEFRDSSTASTASFDLTGGEGDGAFGGILSFENNANAGSANIRNRAGRLGVSLPLGETEPGFAAQTIFSNAASAFFANIENDGTFEAIANRGTTHFSDLSTAHGATIVNHGSSFVAGTGGATFFAHNSTAAQSTITNESAASASGDELSGGTTFFDDEATAGNAVIINIGSNAFGYHGGLTRFRFNSTAGTATITNQGSGAAFAANPGITQFYDDATAGDATITNQPGGADAGRTEFHDRSSAGTSGITNVTSGGGPGGGIYFADMSTAASSELTIESGSANAIVRFADMSTAANSQITLHDSAQGAHLEFHDTATAGDSTIQIGSAGALGFYGYSSAGMANIDIANNAAANFTGGINFPGVPSVTAANATITVRGGPVAGRLDFSTNATAGNAQMAVEGGNGPGTLGGHVYFGQNSATAGSSTILVGAGLNGAPGGRLTFTLGADADSATIITQDGAVVDLSGNQFYGGTSIGSLVGIAGTVVLENSHLNAGGLGLDNTFNGQLVDLNPAGTGGTLTKVGAGTLTLGGANTYAGLTTVAQGRLNVNGSIAGDAAVQSGAILGGSGTIAGDVIVATGGTLAPGTSPGTLTVGGLQLDAGSTSLFELGPTSDQVLVNDALTLGGSLVLSVVDGFNPVAGQSFSLFTSALGTISGQFSDFVTPAGFNLAVGVEYGASDILLRMIAEVDLPGDYNSDGTVDAADYTVWRDHLGSSAMLPGDTSPGMVTAGDFQTWRNNFGATTAAGRAATVPEPASAILVWGTALIALLRNRGMKSGRKIDNSSTRETPRINHLLFETAKS